MPTTSSARRRSGPDQRGRAGDSHFFAEPGAEAAHHVGIVAAPGVLIHAPETGRAVVEEPLSERLRASLSAAGWVRTARYVNDVAVTTPAPTLGGPALSLLVLAAVVSVQFGGAIAATLVPQIGAAAL